MKPADLTNLTWNHSNRGISLIATDSSGAKRRFYKLPYYNEEKDEFTGCECINEVVVSRFLDIIGISHVHYEPLYAKINFDGKIREVLVCYSDDFVLANETPVCIDNYFEASHVPYETPLEFCKRIGISQFVYEMIAVDYLIMNRDRYAQNIQLLIDKDTGAFRPAPLFDHGDSLLIGCNTNDEIISFDPMVDQFSLMYIGIWRTGRNLKLIPQDERPVFTPFRKCDANRLFRGLSRYTSPLFRDKVCEMLIRRQSHLLNLWN